MNNLTVKVTKHHRIRLAFGWRLRHLFTEKAQLHRSLVSTVVTSEMDGQIKPREPSVKCFPRGQEIEVLGVLKSMR